jgi:hypothetical protein
MTEVFQTAASLDGVMPRKDGSMSLRFITQELPASEKALLMDKFFNQFGWVLFKMNEIQEMEIPTEDADVEGHKQKKDSVRLYNTIWVYGKECKGLLDDDREGHSQLYHREMEKLINVYKDKLPE